jgi:hypothetical protein
VEITPPAPEAAVVEEAPAAVEAAKEALGGFKMPSFSLPKIELPAAVAPIVAEKTAETVVDVGAWRTLLATSQGAS